MTVIFFYQAEDGIRDGHVTGVQTCALPILDGDETSPLMNTTAAGCWRASSNVRTTNSVLWPKVRWIKSMSRDTLPESQIGRASCRERTKSNEAAEEATKNKTIEYSGGTTSQ